MNIKNNVSLKEYTTLKIGGIASNFYEVESINDLKQVYKVTNGEFYIISNGSNLLINDKKTYKNVVYMNKFEKFVRADDNGVIEVSCSLKIQELINYVNNINLGGIEYLYSVPATVGGAIYMNAGRGKCFNKAISDYILDVTIYDGNEIKIVNKNECDFKYRHSIFKENTWIIISARFKFDIMDKIESTQRKKERIKYSKENLDSNNYSAGSVFRESNSRIMSLIRKSNLGWKKGCSYSCKTNNWINNNGCGTYKQIKVLINLVSIIHKIFRKNIKLEYIEWK